MPQDPSKTQVGVESFRRILRILQVASASLEPKRLFRNVVDTVLHEFPRFYHVSVFLVFKHAGVFAPMAIAGDTPEVFIDRYPGGYTQGLEVGLLGRAWKTGRVVLVNDVTKDPGYHSAVAPTTLSELCVPLRVDDDVIGVLNMESLAADAFTPEDVEFFSILADHLANAVKNSLAHEQVAAGGGQGPLLSDPRVAAERTWRDVVDRLPDPLFKVTPGGEIAFANAATLKLLGVTAAALTRRSLDTFLDPAALESVRAALRGRAPDSYEISPSRGPFAAAAGRRWIAFPVREGEPPFACLYKLKR